MAEVVLLQGAENDSLSIYFTLFDKDQSRAGQFTSDFDRAIASIGEFPGIGKKFIDPFRRKLVPGFYDYGIFYVLEGSRVVVHAVLDLRQDPGQILSRLKGHD
jgi:plasmid stabilization system protein ParE